MKKANYAIAAALVMGMAGASAYADPLYVSNVSVPSGEYNIATDIGGSPTNIYYAGIIGFAANPGTSYDAGTTFTLYAFCDDLFHDVGIGSRDQYYTASANAYLAPLVDLTTIHEIAGLAHAGTADFLSGDPNAPAYDEEVQLAIWELEYGNITATDPNLQAAVEGLITQVKMGAFAGNYSYYELVSPCGNATPGSVTADSCQTQGQIVVGNNPVPEPLTLSLFGVSLAGAAAAIRRRRKAHNSAA